MTHETAVRIPVASNVTVDGRLYAPTGVTGLIIFAHGSGSTHLSLRNRHVAETLHAAGFGTLLFDLLTEEEAEDTANRFNIDLLTDRLIAASAWARERPSTALLFQGYFGASTGASAALSAAALQGDNIFSVVSRGGRPDLVPPEDLARVTAPTLLLVGEYDPDVLTLNTSAYQMLNCKKRLVIVPNATHLFEEPDALDEVAMRATEWFTAHIPVLR